MTARLIIFLGVDHMALEVAADRYRSAAALRLEAWPEMERGCPLHPSKHGEVADHVVRDATGSFACVVCTHSDAFVLRVRRRIAEGTLSPAAVALVWVEPDGTEKPIPLNDRGSPGWWPAGVGAEAQAEFHAIRRALSARDAGAPPASARAEQPTLSDHEVTPS